MRHHVVKRIVWALAATALAASALFAYLVAPAPRETTRPTGDLAPETPAAPDAVQLFRAYCGGCHSTQELLEGLREPPDRETSRAELVDFLDGHGAASPEEDEAISDYLMDLAWPP
jgi:mono/diheme cytochrome c family protein